MHIGEPISDLLIYFASDYIFFQAGVNHDESCHYKTYLFDTCSGKTRHCQTSRYQTSHYQTSCCKSYSRQENSGEETCVSLTLSYIYTSSLTVPAPFQTVAHRHWEIRGRSMKPIETHVINNSEM